MLSVVTCMVATLLSTVDSALSDNVLLDQIADETYSKEYHSGVNSGPANNLLYKYGDNITKHYSYNISSNNSANSHLPNVYKIDNKYKLLNFTNATPPSSSNRTTHMKKQNKFVFPKLNPLPDLTGWITVIPLEPTEEGGRQRHGLFRIGRFQNGQYYLNPIRKPGTDLNSSGGLTPLPESYLKQYNKLLSSNKKILHKKMNSGFSNIDRYQHINTLPLEPIFPEDSIATESRGPEKMYLDTKIKHHHHHHHHKYLKTVVKKVPVKVPVKVYVDKPYPVVKKVPYPVEKYIHKVIHKKVPVYIEKEVKVPYPVKIKVAEPYPVKVYHKQYVPEPYPVYKKVPVYHEVKVPVHHHVHHTVEKRVPYPVKVPVEVKVPIPVEVEKKILYPVKIFVPKPYPVEKIVPQTVIKHVPVPVYVEKHTEEDHLHHHYPSQHLEKPTLAVVPATPSLPIAVYDYENDINSNYYNHDGFLQRKSSGDPVTFSQNTTTLIVNK